ncbi:hypothetical protein [Bartonella sp. DGB2]|uniref:hypothetical protein n=1 Tax=Bartonella sp. DGB2 TaxID=3388426 RepID=UPI00398FD87B
MGNSEVVARLRKGGRVWPETEMRIRAFMKQYSTITRGSVSNQVSPKSNYSGKSSPIANKSTKNDASPSCGTSDLPQDAARAQSNPRVGAGGNHNNYSVHT